MPSNPGRVLFLLLLLFTATSAGARRIKLRLDTKAPTVKVEVPRPQVKPRTLSGDTAVQAVHMFGYDKPVSSTRESLFVRSQLTGDTITSVRLFIKYETPTGTPLSQREVDVPCLIAPGQTQRLQFTSWDATHTFYYYRTPPSRSGNASPYRVSLAPVSITL